MQASWRLFLVHLALLVTGVALQVPPIVSLATALNYPMPNKNWCTWPGVTCAPSNEPQRMYVEIHRKKLNKMQIKIIGKNYNCA